MDVYWLEQSELDVPTADDWLSSNEVVRLNGMRVAKRRADWRLGRWTAKCALAIYLTLPDHPQSLQEIEVRPAPSGAPEAFVSNAESGRYHFYQPPRWRSGLRRCAARCLPRM